jgi:nitrile hydratase subunit beta
MNGIHDLGGMHGFGPVVAQRDEPVFRADWEGRIFALNLAMFSWRLGNLRAAIEQMPAAEYLATTYYEHWLHGLQLLLEQSGLVEPDELQRVREAPATVPAAGFPINVRDGALRREDARALGASRGDPVDDPVAPRFVPGQAVLARNIHPVGHTRLPRYARGRRGVVDRDHGVFEFPDSTAVGAGVKRQHVYSVRFAARELWGPTAPAPDRIYIDLWDDYLDPA